MWNIQYIFIYVYIFIYSIYLTYAIQAKFRSSFVPPRPSFPLASRAGQSSRPLVSQRASRSGKYSHDIHVGTSCPSDAPRHWRTYQMKWMSSCYPEFEDFLFVLRNLDFLFSYALTRFCCHCPVNLIIRSFMCEISISIPLGLCKLTTKGEEKQLWRIYSLFNAINVKCNIHVKHLWPISWS